MGRTWPFVIMVLLVATGATSTAAAQWVTIHDAYGAPDDPRLWMAPGRQLRPSGRARGNQTELRVDAADGGFLGMGRPGWTVATLSVPYQDVTISIRSVDGGRLAVVARQRDPSCGTLCDEPGVMESMARTPVVRACFVLRWTGSELLVEQSWSTMNQRERPPAWVRQLQPPL